MRNNNTAGVRRNNWPPLPDKFCVQPCFYHDINIDIPSEFQKIVQHLYYLWIFYAGVMAANVIAALLVMLESGSIATFFLSIFYCGLFTPASFLCWWVSNFYPLRIKAYKIHSRYRPAYKAFKDDSSANFMLFFFVFFFQLLIMVVQTLGLPGEWHQVISSAVFSQKKLSLNRDLEA